MTHRLFLIGGFAAAVLLASGTALADPSIADRENARAAMDDGDKKRDAGDLKGALKSYEAADALMKVPTTGLEVARTQVALNMLLEARETLTRVLRLPAKANEPAPFVAARKAADTMNNELSAKIPSILVSVQNADPGATPSITIDNDTIPAAAAAVPRKVNPGAHSVLVKVGTFEKKQDVQVASGESKTVTVDVKEKPAGSDKPPNQNPDADSGNQPSPLPKILLFGGFGLAAVGIGVGAVTGLMSISKTNEIKDGCTGNNCPTTSSEDIDSAKSLGNISTIAFVVGGLGVGAGIIGLVMSGNEKKEPPASAAHVQKKASPFAPERVRAVLGPSYVGVAGAF